MSRLKMFPLMWPGTVAILCALRFHVVLTFIKLIAIVASHPCKADHLSKGFSLKRILKLPKCPNPTSVLTPFFFGGGGGCPHLKICRSQMSQFPSRLIFYPQTGHAFVPTLPGRTSKNLPPLSTCGVSSFTLLRHASLCAAIQLVLSVPRSSLHVFRHREITTFS